MFTLLLDNGKRIYGHTYSNCIRQLSGTTPLVRIDPEQKKRIDAEIDSKRKPRTASEIVGQLIDNDMDFNSIQRRLTCRT